MNAEQARKKLDALGMDWLAFAVQKLGGIEPAAQKLKVAEATIIRWLEHGLAGVRFDKIAEVARLSTVDLAQLAGRLGPFPREEAMECYRVIEAAEKREAA